MIPAFREAILQIKEDASHEPEDNLLYQLQLLFGRLANTDRMYINTSAFCHAYKDYQGNPTNVSIQMDVDEFFKMLLDKLEI